jgi:hypothetical protein
MGSRVSLEMLTSVKREASGPTSPNFGLTRERKVLHAQLQLNADIHPQPNTMWCTHNHDLKRMRTTHALTQIR